MTPSNGCAKQTVHDEPIRIMALHVLAYCPRLFYLEEVEEIRLADSRVFAGRTLHELVAPDDRDSKATQLELAGKKTVILGIFQRIFTKGTSQKGLKRVLDELLTDV